MKKLQKMYEPQDPNQMKMKIMWMALRQILKALYGDGAKNKKVLKYYDDQWRKSEQRRKEC